MNEPVHAFPFESVPDDLACLGCGYNLKFLPVTGVCPECARDVATSIRHSLVYADRNWIETVADGTWWLLVGTICVAVALTPLVLAGLTNQGKVESAPSLCFFVLAYIPYSTGTLMIAAAQRRTSDRDPQWVGLPPLWPVVVALAAIFGVVLAVMGAAGLSIIAFGIFSTAYAWPQLVSLRLVRICDRAFDITFARVATAFRVTWCMGGAGFLALFLFLTNGGWTVGSAPLTRVGWSIELVVLSLVSALHAWLLLRARKVLREVTNPSTV